MFTHLYVTYSTFRKLDRIPESSRLDRILKACLHSRSMFAVVVVVIMAEEHVGHVPCPKGARRLHESGTANHQDRHRGNLSRCAPQLYSLQCTSPLYSLQYAPPLLGTRFTFGHLSVLAYLGDFASHAAWNTACEVSM